MQQNPLVFTVELCLGKGGYGEVYLATVRRPPGPEQRVAVKVLLEGLRNQQEAARRLKVEPQYCIVFEDSDFGLEAARRAGMVDIDIRPWIDRG